MTTRRLAQRVELLAALAAQQAQRGSTRDLIRDELRRDNPMRLLGVVEALEAAHVLDRYCVDCSPGPRDTFVLDSVTEVEWGCPMPWDVCRTCGGEVALASDASPDAS